MSTKKQKAPDKFRYNVTHRNEKGTLYKYKDKDNKTQSFRSTAKLFGHKIKPAAVSELSNDSNLVYILGGNPTYIHSQQKYFEYGLKTAIKQYEMHLNHLVNEQKGFMRQSIQFIDKQWQENLEKLGMNWNEFQNYWEKTYNSGQATNPAKYEMLMLLNQLKKVKVAKTARDIIYKQYTNNPEKRWEALFLAGFVPEQIQFKNSKKNTLNFSGTAYAEIDKEYKKLIEQLYNSPEYAAAMGKTYKERYDALKEGESLPTPTSMSSTVIGTMQELLEAASFEGPQELMNEMVDAVVDNNLEKLNKAPSKYKINAKNIHSINIAAEKQHIKGFDTQSFKGDSIDLIGGVSFLSSIKTGAIYDYEQNISQSAVQNGILKPDDIKTIKRFTASLNTTSLDFSNLYPAKISSVYAKESDSVNKLMNYVLRNAAAFHSNKSINDNVKEFKTLIVCYLAWLKILSEIIGDHNKLGQIPIAIRNGDEIYNSADVIRLFVNLPAQDILNIKNNFINTAALDKFFSLEYMRDSSGKYIMNESQKFALYDLKRSSDVWEKKKKGYRKLYNSIRSGLTDITAATLALPGIKTWFQIKLDNLIQRSE